MHIVLFDEILERHTVRSLARALADCGHKVTQTGAIWKGHQLPTVRADLERIESRVREVARLGADLVINLRASTLLPEMVATLRQSGAKIFVWLPDDPVLYQICYQHVVDAYDWRLHCGDEDVLAFYESRHGRAGINFPFWTDSQEYPHAHGLAARPFDLVFLGNCQGQVRAGRYGFISSLPFRIRVFGKVAQDPFGIWGGRLEGSQAICKGLAQAHCGLNIPQMFKDYRGSEYDFPELADMSHFQFPSRVIQYAGVGMPIVSLEPRGCPSTFPELVIGRDRDELIEAADGLLRDRERLEAVAAATRARFERSFSAAARAVLLEQLVQDPDRWKQLSAGERATAFASILQYNPGECQSTARRTVSVGMRRLEDESALPSVEKQRETLRSLVIESPRKWRILHFGWSRNGETDIVASLKRSLSNLGHSVLHIDPQRHPQILEHRPDKVTGYGPIYLRLAEIEKWIERFEPQVIICNAGGLCFSAVDGQALAARGILLVGLTLSDPDVQPSMIDHVGRFDFHTTNSQLALKRYVAAGLKNTSLLPFGIDRSYVLADVETKPEFAADVICLGHATNRPQRRALMTQLASRFDVRVYGRDWELPHATVVSGRQMLQASRGGRMHVSFAATYAGHTNVKCGVFESIGSGAVVCTQRFDEMQKLFAYDTELIGFETAEDLASQLEEILADESKYEALRRRAFRRLLREHLYEFRWLELFGRIEDDVFGEAKIVGPQRATQLRQTLSESGPRRKRVIVSGYYGARNTGDELILRSIIEGVRRERNDVQIVVAGENPARIERLHACPSFDRRDIQMAQTEISSAAAVVLGGGGLWHDYTYRSAGGSPSLFSDNQISLTGYGKLPLLARMHGRPFHVFGMGVGPLTQTDAKQFVRFLVEQADSVVVRDSESCELLKKIDGWRQPVTVCPDPVFGLTLDQSRVPDEVRELANGGPLLAINLRPWPQADDCRLYENIARALEQLSRQRGCALVGVPMQGGETIDEAILKRVFAMVHTPRPTIVLDWTDDFESLFGVLRASDALLGMRLHACLLAHRLGTPTVGIAYDPKVRQHFDQLGAAEFALPLDASPNDFVDRLTRIMDRPAEHVERITERVKRLETEARAGIRQLAERLGKAREVHEIAPIHIGVRRAKASPQSRAPAKADAVFEEPCVNLSKGQVRGGSLLDTEVSVPVIERGSPNRIWFHMERSDPHRGDFAEFVLPIDHETGAKHAALIHVRSPYLRPKNEGRLIYQVWLNGCMLLEEDIALWDETNSVRIFWRAQHPRSELVVRVVARRDCEPWNWGRAGRIVIHRASHRPCDYSGVARVVATSPFSSVTAPERFLADGS